MSMLLTRIHQQKSGDAQKKKKKKKVSSNQICGAGLFSCWVFVLTPQPQVTLIAGSFALFNVSLTVHTRGYWYQRPANICSCNAGQKRLQAPVTVNYILHSPSKQKKMTQP